MAFPFLGIFLLIIFILAYYRRKSTKQQKQVEENFWNREAEANQIRRQDISGLSYITIPFEKFPIGISSDEELMDYEADLKALADVKILNLGGQTNTDLKLKYGVANLPALTEYDQNYTRLARVLVMYAKCLLKNNYEFEARKVLEFGIETGSDISSNYILLAEIYQRHSHFSELDSLIEKAGKLDSFMKTSILEQLNQIRNK